MSSCYNFIEFCCELQFASQSAVAVVGVSVFVSRVDGSAHECGARATLEANSILFFHSFSSRLWLALRKLQCAAKVAMRCES